MKKMYFTEEERKKAARRRQKLRYRSNPEKYKNNSKKRAHLAVLARHNLTIGQYNSMLALQDGKCALFEVCGSIEPGRGHKHWCVDHDPKTGKVRGLLCHVCNVSRVGTNTARSACVVVSYLERAE